jgi:hypothetical protein
MKTTMLSDNEFRRLLDHIDRPWSGYRKVRKGVMKRLRRHMTVLACPSIQAYLEDKQANELPVSCGIAWYEQKAVAVLLALLFLGVK